MRLLRFLPLLFAVVLASCHEVKEYDATPRQTFEQLWSILDEHYCFFREKGVDWEEVHSRYAPMVTDRMTSRELFDVMARMLDELRDGHTNLSASFSTSYYRRWWADYPENFDWRLVQENYLNFNYISAAGIDYAVLASNIGYIRYSSFSSPVGEGNLDAALSYLAPCDGLIIDVRSNSGGSMTYVETIARRFITDRTLAYSICHKTGPEHDAFSDPYPVYFNPAPEGRVMWGKPVVVLCNRGTFSAGNIFVSVMKSLPGVTVAGATTGGGSGMPFNSELTCGWGVRFSASPLYDADGRLTEFGVEPTEGCAVDLDPEAALAGRDTMIDFAVGLLGGDPQL